jgi:Rad3-related DNA helicase
LRFAHVVFLSYSYLFNEGYRDTIKDYLQDSIIIFDEAHNVVSSAEENQSFELDNILLSQSISEMKDFFKFYSSTKTSHLKGPND